MCSAISGRRFEQALECSLVEPVALDRRQRRDRRGTPLPREQAHLAEELSVVQAAPLGSLPPVEMRTDTSPVRIVKPVSYGP